MKDYTELVVKIAGNVLIVVAVVTVFLIAGIHNLALMKELYWPVGIAGFIGWIGVNAN